MLSLMWFKHVVLPTLFLAVAAFSYCSAVFTEQDAIYEGTEANEASLVRQRRATCGGRYDCKNGGVCITSPAVMCLCPNPYTSSDCSSIGNYCELPQEDKGISLPVCRNGGTCTPFTLTSPYFTCTCVAGYNGTRCETNIDDCASKPCVNGQCTDLVNAYSCSCYAGWEGRNCQINRNDCPSSTVCLNGGKCVDGNGTYTCDCSNTGFTGSTCQINIDDCASKPCVNGQCTDLVKDYNCSCYAGWEGRNCSVDTDYCLLPMLCLNGGRCIDGNSTFTCDCSAIDYSGVTCSSKINDCQSNPCLNGGICIDGLRNYSCNCSGTGFYGTNCSLNVDDCSPNTCMNGATCADLVNNYICSCHAAYTGRNCSTDIVDCTENKCENGGICYERSNSSLYNNPSLPSPFNGSFSYSQAAGFLCVCQPGYSGSNCSVDIPDCSPNPCESTGVCFEKSKVAHYEFATMPSPFNRKFNVSNAFGFMCLYPASPSSNGNAANYATVAGIAVTLSVLLSVSIFIIVLSQIGKGNISLGVFETAEQLKNSEGEKLPTSVGSTYLIPDRNADAADNERMYDNPVNMAMQKNSLLKPQNPCETATDAAYVDSLYIKPDVFVSEGNWASPPINLAQVDPHLVQTSANNGNYSDDVYDEAGQQMA